MSSTGSCKRCSKPTPHEDTLLLWDGESYCKACVQAVSPALVEYAGSHDILRETAPLDRRSPWLGALRMEIVLYLLAGVLLATASYMQNGPLGIVYGLVVATVVCFFQAAIQMPMWVHRGRLNAPTIIVRDGQIECFRGENTERACQRAPLREITWRIGKSRQDSRLRNTCVRRQPVVLLTLPSTSAWTPGLLRQRYACGWTPDTMHLWTAFLTLAEVPKT